MPGGKSTRHYRQRKKAIAAILAISKQECQNHKKLLAYIDAKGKLPNKFSMSLVEKEIREIDEIAEEFGLKLPSLDILDSELPSHNL